MASGLPSQQILDVLDHPEGAVYAATPLGVAVYDGYRWQPVAGLPMLPPRQLLAYPGGRVVAVFADGTYLGSGQSFGRLPLTPSQTAQAGVLPDGRLLLQDRNRNHWIYDNGKILPVLSRDLPPLPPSFFQTTTPTPGFLRANLRAGLGPEVEPILARVPAAVKFHLDGYAANAQGDRLLNIAFPVEVAGLWEWRAGGIPRRVEGVGDRQGARMELTANGTAVVVEGGGSIWLRNRGVWKRLEAPGPPLQRAVFVRGARDGGWWVASDGSLYLHRHGRSLWRQLPLPRELGHAAVNDFVRGRDGTTWLATGRGLIVVRPGAEPQLVTRAAGRPLAVLTSVAEDAQGHIWISSGRDFDGAFRFDGRQWRYFGPAEGFAAGPVHRILAGRDGELWFLRTGRMENRGPGGVTRYRNGRFEPWAPVAQLRQPGVYSLAEAPDGAIWIAGVTNIARWKDGAWRIFGEADGVIPVRQFSIAVDGQGRAWFSDRQSGLGRIDPSGRMRRYTVADGLTSNEVWQIAIDTNDDVWASTAAGLSRVLEGRIERYGPSSGLATYALWPVKALGPSLCVGHLAGGLSCLDRDQYPPSPRAFGSTPVLQGDQALFHWYAASYWGSFPDEELETRYRIGEGAWTAWSHAREASILGIRYGTHRIQIQARAPFGKPGDDYAEIAFTIPPPFYRTGLFYVLSGLALALLAGVGVWVWERRSRFQRELEAHDRRFRALIEHGSDCILLFNEVLRIEYVSPSLERLTGYPAARFLGRTGASYIHPEDRETILRHLALLREKPGESLPVRYRFRLPDGTYHWIEAHAVNRLGDPDVHAIVWTARDIHEKVVAEEAILAAQRQAEKASDAKSEFLATMSHEIRTPMNGILGMMDMLALTPLNGEQREYCRVIQASADSLLHIINDILDLSRIERGALELEAVPFDIAELLADIEDLLRPTAVNKGIELRTSYPLAAPLWLRGDPGRLRQILLNLAANAVKFTDVGAVQIDVQVEQRDAAVRLRMAVRDTGIGIAAEKLPGLFQRFVQGDASTTRRYGGSGLGLAITKRLVELMAGSIAVESTPGAGSVFTVCLELPAAAEALRRPPAPAASFRPLGARILLAEDNLVNRMVAERMLHRFDCEVEVAEDGAQAVALWEKGGFDLILMDCHMPRMDGFEATREIRLREAGRPPVPIVALTANAMDKDRESCFSAGMSGFLSKPIAIDKLYRAIETSLGATYLLRKG